MEQHVRDALDIFGGEVAIRHTMIAVTRVQDAPEKLVDSRFCSSSLVPLSFSGLQIPPRRTCILKPYVILSELSRDPPNYQGYFGATVPKP